MSDRPEETIRGLVDGGPRVAGTGAAGRALDSVSERLAGLGFRTEEHVFECPLWDTQGKTRLSVEGFGELQCAPMIGSVSGATHGRPEHHGRMLVWGDKSWSSYRLVRKDGTIAAYVLVRPDGGAAPQPLPPGASNVPHVVVGSDSAREIELAEETRRLVSVSVDSLKEPARGRNVRAWTGEDALSRGGAILVTAHVDTVPGTPGAYDNAGGVAALVEVAGRVAEGLLPSRVQPLLTDGEELHLAGSRAFVADLDAEGLLGNVAGCLNLDGAGRGDVLDVWSDPESLADHVLPLVEKRSTRFTFPPPQAGDHTAFRERGIPSIMLTVDDPEIIHRAEDVFEPAKLDNALRMARTAARILERLTQQEVW